MEIQGTSNAYIYANNYVKRNTADKNKTKTEGDIYLATGFEIDPDMPFYDLMEIVKEQEKNAPPRTVPAPDTIINKAIFDDPRRFSSTGNKDTDSFIELGLRYTDSCCDMTDRNDFDRLTAEQDFTGMTDTEKFLAIYQKYQHCYGEEFIYANAVKFPRPAASEDRVHLRNVQYRKEMEEALSGRYCEARCEALYGTTDKEEVRRKIIDKFVSEDGSITYRDFFKMVYEMNDCGVGEYMDPKAAFMGMTAREAGCKTDLECLDFITYKKYTAGVNDPYTLLYNRLDENISSAFVSELKKLSTAGSNNYSGALSQVLAAVKPEDNSYGSGAMSVKDRIAEILSK